MNLEGRISCIEYIKNECLTFKVTLTTFNKQILVDLMKLSLFDDKKIIIQEINNEKKT